MTQYTYLLIDLGCISVPLAFSFHPKYSFYKLWHRFFPINLVVAFFFLLWDGWFTHLGIWGFNPDYLTGIYLFNLPVEEVLFFICIPYACVFIWHAFGILIKTNPLQPFERSITYTLCTILLISALFNTDKIYTFTTFSLTSIFLGYSILAKRPLADLYLCYLGVLPFFFLSNGILTGSFLAEPVVWYNDLENLGLRMFTIPVEDAFYGLLLVGLNVLPLRQQKFKPVPAG